MRLTRGSQTKGRRLIVLAPRDEVPWRRSGGHDECDYDSLIKGMQRFRGATYLADGAIKRSQLSEDGRHIVNADRLGWHVLLVEGREVKGCARFVSYPDHVGFGWLGVSRCPLSLSDRWGLIFRHAVQQEMASARRQGLACVEVGGWALSEDLRCTMEALRIALACYSLAQLLGGCIGLSTVTWRHGSSTILRRIGGRPLEIAGIEMPSYFDPFYDCPMEVLRFDSRDVNPRFRDLVDQLSEDLFDMVVYRPSQQQLAAAPSLWAAPEPAFAFD